MRRVVVAGGVVVVAGVVGGVLVWGRDGSQAQGARAPLATAVVSRGDLVDTEKVDGKLTYGDVRDVWGGASGVVTWAPEAGATVRRGRTLFSVAGKPVTLMYGGRPMYRTLREGVSGRDVRQLEENLRALGYGGVTVDGEFTGATEAAVEEWQDDRGLEETGRVDPGQVVFLGGAVRVRESGRPRGSGSPRASPS
ncbi:peptidoglycan-binding domain-containing protein [Spirillospora sp. CA-108201]